MSGLYIHIPFCKQACHYCDFHFSTSMAKKQQMVSALCKELELRKDEFEGEIVETIYFGGGTPSVLSFEEIRIIINTVYANYTVVEKPEVTLEANPDDLISTTNRCIKTIFEQFKRGGINRLSIGIQSFFDDDLKLMNRAHNAVEAERSLEEATLYFDNISIDLIYGMPNMSVARWEANIEKALSFGIPHISSYALTVEPKTALANFVKKGIVVPATDEVAQQHYELLTQKLNAAGYSCYEISNFGKPGYFSKNNTAYWLGKKYIGIGPSAHSFDGGNRQWNINNNLKYIASINKNKLPMERETLSKEDVYNEYVMTGLRTIWGVSLVRIKDDFGNNYYDYLMGRIGKFEDQKLLYVEADTLLATQKGKFLIDGIAADLFMVKIK